MSDFTDDVFLANGRVRPDVVDEATALALRDSLSHARGTNWDSVRTPHLFMGLLGGAMATNLRADQPLFSHTLFSLYLGLVMWSGLWLRDEKLRAVFPWRRKDA